MDAARCQLGGHRCDCLDCHGILAGIRDCESKRILGRLTYDVIIAACARKVHADRILTWNGKHFGRLQGVFSIETPEQS